MHPFWVVTGAMLVAQLVALLVYSTHLYDRFDVSIDFAHNVQAWFLIGHGHLSPTDTVRLTPTPFWRDHFDLIVWPLSLLRWLWPQPVVLLWVQDLAVVAAELVTLCWVAALCAERLPRQRNTAGIVALVALVANPWWYETVSFDVHLPPLGLPLVVLCAYSLWQGRYRRACIAAGLALLFGVVVAQVVVVVGVAALCSRRVRQSSGATWALGITGGGLLWIALVNVLGANQASNLAANYGYLANAGQNPSLLGVLEAVFSHPSRVAHMLGQRWRALVFELAPTGIVGLLTPWGLAVFLGVLVPYALTDSTAYSSATGGAFQNLPAMPFLFIGSVMVLLRVATVRSTPPAADERAAGLVVPPADASLASGPGPLVAVVMALGLTGVAVGQGVTMVRRIPQDWLLVSAKQAGALQQALDVIPSDAEVIASYGVIGRFSERQSVVPLVAGPQTFAVDERTVYFVITPSAGIEPLDAADAQADVQYIHQHLRATSVIRSHGVSVLEWAVPSGVVSVTLPGSRGS